MLTPFHLAFHVCDLEETRDFYIGLLGAKQGRESETWIDFSLFGHQLSAHFSENIAENKIEGSVDGTNVPMPHFGVILKMDDWSSLANRLSENDSIQWVLKPHIRFEGQAGEQGTFFILDPSGNALEFKGFKDLTSIF